MDNSEDKMPGGVAKKIDVSFDETEKQFNEDEKTLEDIIDEELASEPVEESEPVRNFDEGLSEETSEPEPVEIPRAPEKDAPKLDEPVELEEEPVKISEKEAEEIREPVVEERPVKVYGKRKSGKGLIIFLVILIILLVAGFAVYYCLSTGVIKSDLFGEKADNCIKPADPVDKKETPNMVSGDEKVVEIVNGIRAEIERNHDKSANLITTYNHTFPLHKINEDGTLFALNKSYGLYYQFNGDEWIEFAPQLNSEATKALTDLGFAEYADGPFETKYYINNDSGIICGPLSPSSNFWSVACANENWISEENEKLATNLADAYKTKKGEPMKYIAVEKEKISDSGKNKGYEAIMAQGNGAAEIFYKKKTDTKWTYAFGAQDIPSCSLFDEEMREALSGWTGHSSIGKAMTCVNEETGAEEEV